MKKIYLFILAALFFVMASPAQVVVTNPTNTIPNLSPTYPTLLAAISSLNAVTLVNGPVTITLNAGFPQTAPSGGYSINFTASTSAANNIIFEGSGNTITASASLTAGSLTDAIFKLVGVDYVTIRNFVMQENAANTINSPALSNNMTEWGVSLLRSSLTNGSQNNTIQNNTISLSRTYRNSFGIYSNARHTSTVVDVGSEATALSGTNSGNKVYGNTISNVAMGISFVGTSTTAFHDSGNDIGGTSASTGNTISNWGGNFPLTSFQSVSLTSFCIYVNHQVSDNVSYNNINSGVVGTGANTTFSGIRKDYTIGTPTGTFTTTISNNTVTMNSDFDGTTLEGIRSQGMGTLSTATININDNNIINCSIIKLTTTSTFFGIVNSSAPGTLNMNNNIIRGLTTVSTGNITGIANTGAVVNTININNNKVGDAIAGAATNTTGASGAVTAISNSNGAATATVNMNNNSFDGFSFVTSAAAIMIQSSASNPAAVNIHNNQFGTVTGNLISYSGAQGSTLAVIHTTIGNSAMAYSIQNNDIRGITHASPATGLIQLILTQATAQSTLIHNNTFTNLSINSSGIVRLVARGGTMAAGATITVTSNRIVGSSGKTASGGNFQPYLGLGFSPSGVAITISGNDFQNISITGNTQFGGITDLDGSSTSSSPAKTITGNMISNVSFGSGSYIGIQISNGENLMVTSNTITNASGSGAISGINYGLTGTGNFDFSANTISSLTSNAGSVYGILSDAANATTLNVHDNNITGLTSAGAVLAGILLNNAQTANFYNNIINDLTNTAGGSSAAHGIWINGGTTANVYNNKIHTLLHSGAVSTTSPAVTGINISTGTDVTAYNNFVANLNATNASLADAIRGINVTGSNTLTNYNLYYNSIYINASSSGTDFGTSGIYHTANPISTTGTLRMINNIIVNTSTPNGTGLTAAYRRSSTSLDNYASVSNNNLFYAGTPAANQLLFYDGTNSDLTLASYKARVSTRDSYAVSLMPVFVSATDLHLTTANCQVEGRGTPISVTTDIDNATRNATTPDIGADEFNAVPNTTLAGIAGSAVCEDRVVAATGTYYTTNSCNLIARIVPSGGDPVSGSINACVTIDATQQYFNGEPYVQRHYDLEPAVSNETTTSATVTLYFTNAEFIQYNTNNPVWPALPVTAADPNITNVKVTQFHGTPTGGLPTTTPGNYTGARVLVTPTSVVLNGSVWEVTFNISGFSGFYVHTNMWNAPLPVSVNYFTGTKQGSGHLLNWKVTCNSTPRVTMQLERSADSRNFNSINSISADAARCSQPFTYTDAQPLAGINYYRLKMMDANGKITYSSMVALLNASKGFEIISIAPNPVVTDRFTLNISSAQGSKMETRIVDLQGRVVDRRSQVVTGGFNSMPVNIAGLASGTYILQASIPGETPKQLRFVKQ